MKPVVSAVILAALVATPAWAPASAQAPAPKPASVKATIDSGVLVGETQDGVNFFRGVPFAKAPIGDLRWKAPAKPDKWPGERIAVAYEPPCPQVVNIDQKTTNGGGVAGVQSEDCLYLNVFAPANAKNAPIMVWLYGGAGNLGAAHLGSFNGTSNAKNGVITVTANYRLGSLGGFAHPALTKEAGKNGTGAFALMDAVAALEWVKRNAAALGGDPNNVTLAGQSAGGSMVTSLLSVPSAKGLYAKAVIESGAAIGPGTKLADLEPKGVEAAKALGLPENATLAQLRAVSAQTLAANEATRRGFGAPIDGKFKPSSTIDALNAGSEIDVPVLVGTNSGEGGFDAARTLAKLAGAKGAGAWLYNFAYTPSYRSEWAQDPIHSGEIMFAFDSLATSSWAMNATGKANDADRAVAKKVNSCWVSFYKMDPKAKSFTCADGFVWQAFTEGGDEVAQFGASPKLVKSKTIPNGPPPAAPAPARTN